MTTINFTQDTSRFVLYLDRLPELAIKNIRKIFTIMLSEPGSNEDAILSTSQFLTEIVPSSKEAWAQASREYQNGWRLAPNTKSRHPQVLEIRRENRRLTEAVKCTKKQYERWLKLQTLWNDTKHTMN